MAWLEHFFYTTTHDMDYAVEKLNPGILQFTVKSLV